MYIVTQFSIDIVTKCNAFQYSESRHSRPRRRPAISPTGCRRAETAVAAAVTGAAAAGSCDSLLPTPLTCIVCHT